MKLKLHPLFYSVFTSLILSAAHDRSFAQARIVFGATTDAYMVMSSNAVTGGNPIYLVVGDATGNSLPNTITRTTKGAIISNGENNLLKWYIGNNTGVSYTIPWAYGAGASNYIPMTLTKNNTAAGHNGKFFNFSTYRTGWQNSAMLPAGVTSCYSPSCGCDASPFMVDRFWQIDNADFGGAPPMVDLTFYYVDGGAGNPEVFTTGNSLTGVEANLQAESYNNSSGNWTGSLYGTDDPVNNFVGPGTIPPNFLYKWWVLVEKNTPLPVEWLDVSAVCERGDARVKWSTASEQNADHFTVERSFDGTSFYPIATVQASGNSSTTKNYSWIDEDAYTGTSYYRIRETDFNGESSFSSQMTVNGCGTKNEMGVYPNPSLGSFNVAITGSKDEEVVIVVVDMLGQEFYSKVTVLSSDQEVIAVDPANRLAAGVYTVIATSKNDIIKKKIVIQ